jgi:hypothetical protein
MGSRMTVTEKENETVDGEAPAWEMNPGDVDLIPQPDATPIPCV